MLLIYILTLLISPGDTLSSEDWQLVKREGSISVYTRLINGSRIKEVRVKAEWHFEISQLVAAIEDVPMHKSWVTNTISSKVVDKIEDGHFIYYLSTYMPFPVKDRDVVIEYRRYSEMPGKVITRSVGRPGLMDHKDGFIRIPGYSSRYIITQLDARTISVDYTMKVDPGGILPDWLVNLAIARAPLETMQSLERLILSGKYQHAVVAGLTY